ncbi:MAG: endo-1,4-beta-xylanase, partial [Bacteroidales bacterium]|nr:endo-1,4-beta-xylanase [Bacteroidales bacterium]
MKNLIITLLASILLLSCNSKQPETLKSVLRDKFLIGTALNLEQIYQRDTLANSVIPEQFSAIVPENCMKSMFLQPKEEEFFFDDADKYVEYGEKHNLWIVGHCLVWHSQTPDWFFVDGTGKE